MSNEMTLEPAVPRRAEAMVISDPGSAALVGLLEPALLAIAGRDREVAMTYLNLVFAGSPGIGDRVRISAWIERATRTLVFATAEIRHETDDRLIVAGQAVLKVISE